jgi:hypothetical protein
VSAALNMKDVGEKRIDFQIRAQQYELPEEDFFGFGRARRQEDRTSYLLEGAKLGSSIRVRPAKHIDITGGLHGTDVTFDNAAIRVGAASDSARYTASWSRFDNATGAEQPIDASASVAPGRVRIPHDAWGPQDRDGSRYAMVSIATHHPD